LGYGDALAQRRCSGGVTARTLAQAYRHFGAVNWHPDDSSHWNKPPTLYPSQEPTPGTGEACVSGWAKTVLLQVSMLGIMLDMMSGMVML